MTDFDSDSASSQLRVIRSLMERATIYRSLSAPTALVGGLLSFGGLGLAYVEDGFGGHQLSEAGFLVIWLTILALTSLTNGYFLWQEARRRGQPFFSAGMKCALRSVLPPFLCAGFLTLVDPHDPVWIALFWILFYGLGLLATQHFAPRSIVVLGWTFLVAPALIGLTLVMTVTTKSVWQMDAALVASWYMALTFGLFHVVYAVAVWARGGERADAQAGSATGNEHV